MNKLERFILSFPPVVFLKKESKLLIIPGFRGLPLYDVVIFFFKQVNKVGLTERAAAISFNLLMALPAGLLFLFSLIPYFPKSENIEIEILRLFKDITPNSNTYHLIENLLHDLLNNQHIGIFSFGILLLIFYASNAMMGIITTFDKSIQQHKRIFLHQRWRAIKLTFILMFLFLLTTLILLLGKEQLTFVLRQVFHIKKQARITWWSGIRGITIIALLYYSIAIIYKYAPNVKKRWKIVSPGTILSTVLILLTGIIFSYWVNNFASYNKVYGSIGTTLIIMALIYFNSVILLIGFELNVSITYLTHEAEERKIVEEKKLQDEKQKALNK